MSRQRLPIQNNESTTDAILQQKLSKIAELHNGLEILNGRMSASKTDLITYFSKNPQLKTPKYEVGNRYIRYIDKKTSDGLSQKLITKGLSEYFRENGCTDVETEVSNVLEIILNQRGSKTSPTIDIIKHNQT